MGQQRFYSIYSRAPVWAQNLMVSLKGVDLRYRRGSDRQIDANSQFLMRSQAWGEDEFRAYQTRQLQELLRVAFHDVPHYRELAARLGCTAQDFQRPEDLVQLPVLEKSELRGREHQFLNQTIPERRLTPMFTSGTTGTPLHSFETIESWSRRWAFVVRLRQWAGVDQPLHPRRAQITGRDVVPGAQQEGPYWRFNRADHSLLFSSVHISPDTAEEYVRALRNFRPQLLDGFPSCMLALARCAGRNHLRIPTMRAIITTSETLAPEDRSELEEAFGVPVFDQYGSTEPSAFWCNCAAGTMHINPEYGITELLDSRGQAAAPGQDSFVVATPFVNHAMVLIRYRIGDTAVRGPDSACACGRSMPRVDAIGSRIEDVFYIPGRGFLIRLDSVFKGLTNLVEAQIIQEDLDSLRVLLVPAPGYNAQMEHTLLGNLRVRVGPQIRVSIEQVQRINRGPNGKFQALVSKVRHRYPPYRREDRLREP